METLLMERGIRDRLAGKDQLEVNVIYLSAIERGDWTTVSAIEKAPESFPVLIMELPRYHRPRLKAVAQKTWFRLGEFVAIAWPILIAGSVGLEVFDYYVGYTFFVTFYLPCLATFAALARELGWRAATTITVMTVGIVTSLAVVLRFAVGWVI